MQEAARAILNEYFTYGDFRSKEQEQCITELMSGNDVLALLPTSAGKSLCYQIPALYFEGLTIVVTPLQALMHDQVERLAPRDGDLGSANLKKRIPAEYIDSTRTDKEEILANTAEKKYKLLYVSPEQLMHPAFLRAVRNVSVDLVAVDEAHCLSMWGYDFRPAYLDVLRFLRQLPKRPVVGAFTATASRAVKEDIIRLLKLDLGAKEVRRGLIEGGFRRENLYFSVRNFRRRSSKRTMLLQYVAEHDQGAGIIYCSTIKEAEEVCRLLADQAPVLYHGKLREAEREENCRRFMKGESRLIVATSAFGLGIDKKDVRFVIHYNMPGDIESYYQEAGRAGRDGRKAECVLLCYRNPGDDWDDPGICGHFLETSRENSGYPKEIAEHRYRLGRYRLEQMNRYCDRQKCKSGTLQKIIEDYFQERLPEELSDPSYDQRETAYLEQRMRLLDRQTEEIPALCYNNTRIANEIRKGEYALGEEKQIDCGRRRKAGEEAGERLLISCRIESETGEKLSYFDLMVADAVYTLERYRVPVVYPKHIWELLSGDSLVTLKPERKAAIEQSIERMQKTRIRIDCSGAADGSGEVYEGCFLPVRKEGKKGYHYTDLPPLWQFAVSSCVRGQFYHFPMERLRVTDETGRKLPASVENLKIIHYLLYRLAAMTGNKKSRETGKSSTSRIIRYDTLFRVTGLLEAFPEDDYQRKRKQETVMEKIDRICSAYERSGYLYRHRTCIDKERSAGSRKVKKGVEVFFRKMQ